jgi:hypothetical protein
MSATSPTATKIMIIRHAEKPPIKPPPSGINVDGQTDKYSLIVRGWQRAGALVNYFAPQQGAQFHNPSIATPQFIYASKIETKASKPTASKGKKIGSKSQRPQETVTPLIKMLGTKASVNFTFDKGDEKHLAKSALACKGVVLICWEHQDIPAITKHLPVSPQTPAPTKWPVDKQGEGRFDVVWVFELDTASSTYNYSYVPQCLLAGDSPD